jgi:Leucine-rich repeat (LRR) protein
LNYVGLSHNKIKDISPLINLMRLTTLELNHNRIRDISPLANLIHLETLWLSDNQISDISPLVHNEGLGTGDHIYLERNPLSSDSVNIYIPELRARGVAVDY